MGRHVCNLTNPLPDADVLGCGRRGRNEAPQATPSEVGVVPGRHVEKHPAEPNELGGHGSSARSTPPTRRSKAAMTPVPRLLGTGYRGPRGSGSVRPKPKFVGHGRREDESAELDAETTPVASGQRHQRNRSPPKMAQVPVVIFWRSRSNEWCRQSEGGTEGRRSLCCIRPLHGSRARHL
jgi:hypothetical protein